MIVRRRSCHWLLLSIGAACAATSAIAAELVWRPLLDRQTLDDWQPVGDAIWTIADETIRTTGQQPGFLMREAPLGNFEFQVEFRAPAATNSGVFFSAERKPTDPTADCYELNIAPAENPFPTGSLVGRQRATHATGTFPAANEWHALDVTVVGNRWIVTLDGRTVLDYDDPAPLARRFIGLQSNQGEVAFRDLRIRPILGE